VARRKGRVVEVAELRQPAQRFADLLLLVAATSQLPPQLDVRVGTPRQEPQGGVERRSVPCARPAGGTGERPRRARNTQWRRGCGGFLANLGLDLRGQRWVLAEVVADVVATLTEALVSE
jgi:hypothetical protein